MTMLQTSRSVEDAEQRQREWLLRLAALAVALIVVSTATAWVISALSDPVYGARTDLIYALDDVQSQPQADRVLATQIVVLRSRAVLEPVAENAGLSPEELDEKTDVELLDDSQVIRVTVADPDPERALGMAEDLGERYVDFVARRNEQQLAEQTELLESEVEALREERATIEERLAELSAGRAAGEPIGAEERRLEIELQDVLGAITDRQSQQVALRVAATEAAAALVLTPPYVLEDPLAPRPLRAVAAGLFVGILLAGVTVVLLNRYRRPPT